MDSYVLTLFDDAGNPIPIPAIQGVGIKDIRLEEEHVTHDIYAIVLEDDRIYRFVVRHGENNVRIRNFAPDDSWEGYVGDQWFELPSGRMYICTRGMSRDPSIPSEWMYEWKQLEAVRCMSGAPTTETFGNDCDVWVDTLNKVIYVCLGGGLTADGFYYEWVRITHEKLPNPYALEISGGTLSEPVYYDGTAPVKIQLPTESPKEESGGAPSAPDVGDTAGIYMRVHDGYIQYSEDEETWYDIIAVSELKGDPGRTPEKGVDYWTESDKSGIVADVLAALQTWEGGSY